jgi:hypothetical protein
MKRLCLILLVVVLGVHFAQTSRPNGRVVRLTQRVVSKCEREKNKLERRVKNKVKRTIQNWINELDA